MINIVADENIPLAQSLFSKLGHVSLLPGRSMTNADLKGVDVLLTRSVTKVNEALLQHHAIKFVGTCTIGTDHIDLRYLSKHNIAFSSAPGCNAYGVVQYDIAALAALGKLDVSLKYAIVGCGNVGSRVYNHLKKLGYHCIAIDPNLPKGSPFDLNAFDAIYDCDVILMHTPLVKTGEYPTENMMGADELRRLKPGSVLLNAGRGECIDNAALLDYLSRHDDLTVVLDVWANEPHMLPELFKRVAIGTPHIAGYSFEGRTNGSIMIFEALAKHLDYSEDWIRDVLDNVKKDVFGEQESISASNLRELILRTYDIQADHQRLEAALDTLPSSFDKLRKTYPKRREFSHYLLSESDAVSSDLDESTLSAARALDLY